MPYQPLAAGNCFRSTPFSYRSAARGLAAALLALGVSGCGGGFSFGGSLDSDDDEPPTVDLIASVETIAAGATLRLAAVAIDDGGIERVSFYRLDGTTETLLVSDGSKPYEFALTVSAGAATQSFVARAYDLDQNVTRSQVVTVTVTP